MEITSESKIGEIAAQHPMSTRVFARHGIDFCCGGGRPLREICEHKGLDPDRILEEIEQVLAREDSDLDRWLDASLPDLVRHIVADYHAPLREELPRLESMARKVARVHGAKDPERLEGLLRVFLALKSELEEHMTQEEEVLFPHILAQGPGTAITVAPFVDDHTEAGRALAEIRRLTSDFTVPADACNTWRALWHGLEALEGSLHHHIHLENNVLFPRAFSA